MTLALKLLCRVVRRRLSDGESAENIWKDYPRLSEEEKQQVAAICGI